MAVVAAPEYFDAHPRPVMPADLYAHRCINIRFPSHGNLALLEFEKDGRVVTVRVNATFVDNSLHLGLAAVLDGIGLAWMPTDLVRPQIESGTLIQMLDD